MVAYDLAQYSAASWNGLYNVLASAIRDNREVDVATFKDSYNSDGLKLTAAAHMFSDVTIDPVNGELLLRNPWGVAAGRYWMTQFDQTMEQLKAVGAVVFVATESAGGMPQPPPVRTDAAGISATLVHLETVQFADQVLALSQATGVAVQTLAYSWKAHTLLEAVSVNSPGHAGTTGSDGVASFASVSEASLALSATRPVS